MTRGSSLYVHLSSPDRDIHLETVSLAFYHEGHCESPCSLLLHVQLSLYREIEKVESPLIIDS